MLVGSAVQHCLTVTLTVNDMEMNAEQKWTNVQVRSGEGLNRSIYLLIEICISLFIPYTNSINKKWSKFNMVSRFFILGKTTQHNDQEA